MESESVQHLQKKKNHKWKVYVTGLYRDPSFMPEVPIGDKCRFKLILQAASPLYKQEQMSLGFQVVHKPYKRKGIQQAVKSTYSGE